MRESASQAQRRTEAEIRAEERQLRKAEADIVAGRMRLRTQDRLLARLTDCGAATLEAERLVALMRDSLAEWERHRALIEQRLVYLEARRMRGGRS